MPTPYTKPAIKIVYYDDIAQKLPSLAGKTIAITGTTSGTGNIAAQTLANKGARLILLNRASQRSTESLQALKSKYSTAEFIPVDCDLQSFASVRKAAIEVAAICTDGLNVLCNNAGVMALKDEATADGFDVQMQTNHLSHFLLTKLLMPYLEIAAEKNGEARIVNHSSVARFGKNLQAKYLEKKGGNLGGDGSRMMPFPGGRWVRYQQTKLANAAFTASLHEKLHANNSKIKALVAHPGLATTNLQQTTVGDGGMGSWFTGLFMKSGQSQEDGAIGIIKCMADPDAKSGDFIGPGAGRMAMKGPVVTFALEDFYNNIETRELLWSKSCEAIAEDFVI
ncbi:MAG: SDR family NAD(P)-dependent oxidoreductase [Candidatus Marinimicrobia bacterium]|nr:SDR family NAD(P)-dependent oxidoreductase [Candidatus Neomarinimicrobiota bacterium]